MSVEMLQMVSLICFGIAGVFLLIAVILFFILDVPALIGEVTGATERKAISSIRLQNEEMGNTGSTKSKKPAKKSGQQRRGQNGGAGTAKLSTEKLHAAPPAQSGNETTVLQPEGNETTLLNQPAGSTPILDMLANETTGELIAPADIKEGAGFSVEVEFGYASSAEIIE